MLVIRNVLFSRLLYSLERHFHLNEHFLGASPPKNRTLALLFDSNPNAIPISTITQQFLPPSFHQVRQADHTLLFPILRATNNIYKVHAVLSRRVYKMNSFVLSSRTNRLALHNRPQYYFENILSSSNSV